MSEKWIVENGESGTKLGPFADRQQAHEVARDWNESGVGEWSVRRPNRREKFFDGVGSLVAWILAIAAFLIMLWFWWPAPCIVIGC